MNLAARLVQDCPSPRWVDQPPSSALDWERRRKTLAAAKAWVEQALQETVAAPYAEEAACSTSSCSPT